MIRAACAALMIAACARHAEAPEMDLCPVSVLVLGVAQDGGKPQIGNPNDPAWADRDLRRLATSLALVDRRGARPRRWLFEATPDVKEQLQRLDDVAPIEGKPVLDGVFVTHAHIGHYVGLMFFGHEAMGAENLTAYVMPKMADYLTNNGPWSQLVRYHNILLAIMTEDEPEALGDELQVTPFLVPHRQEFSEVAGFQVDGPDKSILFIPDIDAWEDWDVAGVRIEEKLATVDAAYLDATFFANGEIPGRDMSGFPHPFVSHSLERFSALPEDDRAKIRFIHMNHTNPLHQPDSEARRKVLDAGFRIADEGEAFCL